jgi:diketogulonate reductase-like aldo/keto reductase
MKFIKNQYNLNMQVRFFNFLIGIAFMIRSKYLLIFCLLCSQAAVAGSTFHFKSDGKLYLRSSSEGGISETAVNPQDASFLLSPDTTSQKKLKEKYEKLAQRATSNKTFRVNWSTAQIEHFDVDQRSWSAYRDDGRNPKIHRKFTAFLNYLNNSDSDSTSRLASPVGREKESRYACLKNRNQSLEVTTRSGKTLPWIGYGTDNVKSQETFLSALKTGYRLFDLAERYQNIDQFKGAYDSVQDEIKSEDLFLIYKMGIIDIQSSQQIDRFFKSLDEALSKFHGVLDTVMLHDPIAYMDPTLLKEFLHRLNQYVPKKVRYVGLSNVSTNRSIPSKFQPVNELQLLDDLCQEFPDQFPRLAMIENRFNPLALDSEIRAAAHESHMKYIGYGIFGGQSVESGAVCALASEAANDHFKVELYQNQLDQIGKRYDTSDYATNPHDLLLSWGRQMGAIQIPQSQNISHMESNLKTAYLDLSKSDLKKISELSELHKLKSHDKDILEKEKKEKNGLYKRIRLLLNNELLWPEYEKLIQNNQSLRSFLKDASVYLENDTHFEYFLRLFFDRLGTYGNSSTFADLFKQYVNTKNSITDSKESRHLLDASLFCFLSTRPSCNNGFESRCSNVFRGDTGFASTPQMSNLIAGEYVSFTDYVDYREQLNLLSMIWDHAFTTYGRECNAADPLIPLNDSLYTVWETLLMLPDRSDIIDLMKGTHEKLRIRDFLHSPVGKKIFSSIEHEMLKNRGFELVYDENYPEQFNLRFVRVSK